MSAKAKAIYTLYLANRITAEGVKRAFISKIITESEFLQITNQKT